MTEDTDTAEEPGSTPAMRSRFAPAPLSRSRLNLTARDRGLLCDLYLHRALARRHLQTLYFGSVARCNARLRQLYDAGFVRRHFPPQAPFGAEAIYTLGPVAVELVASELEIPEPVVRAQAERDPPAFLAHCLAVADVRVAFVQAVAERQGSEPQIEIERWLPEPLCRHEYDVRPKGAATWTTEVFAPDGFLRLAVGQPPSFLDLFLEIDLGNTGARPFMGKVASYARYLSSGLFAESYGTTTFAVLVVTTSLKRLSNLRVLARDSGGVMWYFTALPHVGREGPLGSIWYMGAGEGRQDTVDLISTRLAS